VRIELDLGDRSEMIRVERDLDLCELLNGCVGDLLVGRSSETNLASIVLAPFDLLIVLAQDCSCLEFDLTLGVIPSVYVVSSCSLFSLSFFVLSLQVVSLSGPRFIVLAPDVLFCCARSGLIRHIR
jgi:hypothetical protein